MALQDYFMPETADRAQTWIDVPDTYRHTAAWQPQLGDIAPNFGGQTTHGDIEFHDWAEGKWTVLLSLPEKRAGISETEVVNLSLSRHDLAARGARAMFVSPCTLGSHVNWRAEIERTFNINMAIPLMADPTGLLCETLGVIHPKAQVDSAVRKTLIFDPSLRLRWVSEYPSPVGRSMDEILRVIDALLLFDKHQLGAAMDWLPGDAGIVRPDISTDRARAIYGRDVEVLTQHIRTVQIDHRTEVRGDVA